MWEKWKKFHNPIFFQYTLSVQALIKKQEKSHTHEPKIANKKNNHFVHWSMSAAGPT